MKKIIISLIAVAMVVLIGTKSAHAQVFNQPAAMPTITVSSSSANPCSFGAIDGCWKTSTTARAGDLVGVQIYYYNASGTTAQSTTLHIEPRTVGAVSSVTFSGGVASTTVQRSNGAATISLSSAQTITYVPGSARWYPSATSGARAVDENALFGTTGFNIGAVASGQQGILVANFQVGNTVAPQTYQCNDGIDNDADGLIDYPSDPGCDSATDNSEYNYVQQQYCTLDLSADRYNVNQYESVTLSWNSSNCTNLQLTNVGSVASAGSRVVVPSGTTTYTLSGQGTNGTVQDNVVIYTNGTSQSCSIYNFQADQTTINRGDTTYLRWSTIGANSVSITPNNGGATAATGSVSVSPYDTTYYTLTAYCSNGSTQTRSATIYVTGGQAQNGTAPQAITTVATTLGSNAARLNGIAIPSSNVTTYAWFEWGVNPSSLPYYTSKQTITNTASTPFNDGIAGLVAGTQYYYRAAAQNQYGTVYGSVVPFKTSGSTSTTTIIKYVSSGTSVIAKSAPSLLELTVQSLYDHMCVGGEIDYTVSYRNISTTQTLQNTVVRITLPKEIDYIAGSQGAYSVLDRTVTILLGNVPPAAQGAIQIHGKINASAITGNLAVTTATVVYTNTVTHAQEDAIAYSLVTITNECPNLLGASVFGLSFLPHTLIGWLLLILVILALIVLGRQMYKKNTPA